MHKTNSSDLNATVTFLLSHFQSVIITVFDAVKMNVDFIVIAVITTNGHSIPLILTFYTSVNSAMTLRYRLLIIMQILTTIIEKKTK